ncbi:helix-turn-helix transcriptional regulator [Chitinophaga agrisoli]|uniref:Helix-turn-helix transcriptional regulator n=1 Tax=Chitinophaga agrisoli TaxID=2607653 RepID=A0A5B2VWL6_9BACT|nr:AraC family transcriptional regulator [Chitinophaga agrisoli]KAA2243711.1 helix-turn-helix transcriptional regulator [Chitinophaga agrisoli]
MELSIISRIPVAFKPYFIRGAQRLYYCDDRRTVFSQYIMLKDVTLWYHVITVTELVEVSPLSLEPGLKLNFMLSEIKAEAALNAAEKVMLVPGQANLFLVGDGLNYAQLPPGRHIFFHIDLKESTVMKLSGNPAAASMLQAIKDAGARGGGHINMDRPITTNARCSSLIKDIRQHKYTGKAAGVYLLKKAKQLLESFMKDFSGLYPIPDVPLTPEAICKVDEITDYLKKYLSKPLSIPHLCKMLQVKDPELLLNQFTRLNGIPLAEFDHHSRMEMSFEDVVETFTTLPTIARNLGYNNRREFRRAFKSYFDCHPESLRKRGGGKGLKY